MAIKSIVIIAGMIQLAAAGKRGLAFPWYNEGLCSPLAFQGSSNVDYMYNWETWRPSVTGDLNFIGMQPYPSTTSSPQESLAARAAAQGWTDVFCANEPDAVPYAPADVASWYLTYINPLTIHKGYPAVTSNTASGRGLDWLAEFISACSGCYHDYINLHWYGSSLADFQAYITAAHARFPSENMVVSEFALTGASQADQISFFEGAETFLDGLSYVVMYFPFVATSPALLAQYDSGAASYVGTGSCLYNNDYSRSAVGNAVA